MLRLFPNAFSFSVNILDLGSIQKTFEFPPNCFFPPPPRIAGGTAKSYCAYYKCLVFNSQDDETTMFGEF